MSSGCRHFAFSATSGATPLPARQHITIEKLCPPKQTGPSFHIVNTTNLPDVSDPNATPETITFTIIRGHEGNPPALYTGMLAPGAETTVTLANEQWSGTFFARFNAKFKGKVRAFDSKMFCACRERDYDIVVEQ